MKKASFLFALGAAVFMVWLAGAAPAQESPDLSKVVGTWKVEVYGGGAAYHLDLIVTDNQGQLEGKVSESTGLFADVAISEIFYDSETFRFEFVAPTPPDGMPRTVIADFKVAGDKMAGTITVPDLNFVGEATATRQS
jgi:hypothetical protein